MDKKRNYLPPNFRDEYCSMNFADAILETEDGYCFSVHKVILANQYKYFSALFNKAPTEKSGFLIPGLKGEVLRSILTYIYTGKVYLTDENINELTVASDYFMMDDFLSHASLFIKSNLSTDNCLHIFAAARLINRKDFIKDCFRFVQTHFECIVYNSNIEFEELPLDVFKLFLGDRNLYVSNEKSVFLAISKWVNADTLNRQSLVPELITYLAMPEIDEALATEILEDGIIANNPYCKNVIDELKCSSIVNNVELFRKYVEQQTKPLVQFQDKRLPSKLNFIIRHRAISQANNVQVYITYDENIDLWRKLFEIQALPEAILCANGSIYILKTPDSRNSRYDVLEKRWYDLDEFMIPRYNYAVIDLEGTIYVLGGTSTFTEEEIYDVEIYDSMFDVWYATESMFPITSFAAVACKECIYVVGYKINDEEDYEMIAQVYNSQSETWSILPAVSISRSHFTLAAYREKIYVIGGMDSHACVKDVEVFDPVKNNWEKEADLPYTYYYPKTVILDDLLIVYDNHMEDREYRETNPSVYWNNKEACWESLQQSSKLVKLHLYEFLTLENIDYISILTKENRRENFEKSPFN